MMPGVPHLWLSLGLLSGATMLDGHFADYQWRVDPRASYGAEAAAGIGRFAVGLRGLQAQTRQAIGLPDPASTAEVRATTVELTGRARLASVAGFGLAATASGGRMHLGWHPDHVDAVVSGTPVSVDLVPVDSWIGGGGLEVSRRLPGPWRAGLAVDRRFFSMDTAHRSGSSVVTGPETFGDWNARVELSWLALGS